MLKKFSIRKKLILGIVIGCLIPYFAGGMYIRNETETWLYNDYIKRTNGLLRQTSEHVDAAILNNMNNLVSMIAMDERVANVDSSLNSYVNYDSNTQIKSSKIESELTSYFRTIKENHSIINMISLGTEEGGYFEYPTFKPNGPYDPRTRGWYTGTINKKTTVTSEPYITLMSHEIVISFSRSVIFKNNKTGVISLTIKLDDLMKDINNRKNSKSGYIDILSPKNIYINSPVHKEWTLQFVKEFELDALNAIGKNNDEPFEGNIDGKRKILNIYYSPYSGWKYISVIDKSEILEQSKILTSLLVAIYIITFFIILFVVILISNQITKPILKITKAISKMATFNFDLHKESELETYTSHNDEIGEISKALINMEDNYTELKSKIATIDEEIRNIKIDENIAYQLELSKDNPFIGVAGSINGLLKKVHSSIEQIKLYNTEIIYKNELLAASEEELIAQLEEIESQNKYIRFIAEHDSLTNLPNRRTIYDKLGALINNGSKGALILLDLDNFKTINDTQGHLFGDKVLINISQRLVEISNEHVFVSRFGGDEFILIYEGVIDEKEINKFIRQIMSMLNRKFLIDNIEVEAKFSIGVSLFPKDSVNIEQLIMNADLALYFIKNNGKNNFALFNYTMKDFLKRQLELKNILSEAIVDNGFKLVYQPQVDAKSGEIIGYEALARLKNYPLISPYEFISVAEKEGLIITIGRIVTRMAIEQMNKWKQIGLQLKPIAINFSFGQIHDHSYPSYLVDLLKLYDINPDLIVIEITESIFLENREGAITFLNQLRIHGIKIAVDDFGTGYSSLSYLTFLPIDSMKIDRSLSTKFLELENSSVMDSLIALAHSLNMKVVAEGIEEYEQVKRLTIGNCDVIQGYYFSKPIEVEEVERDYGKIYII